MLETTKDIELRKKLTTIITGYFLEMEKSYTKFDREIEKYSSRIFEKREREYALTNNLIEKAYDSYANELEIKNLGYKLPPVHILFQIAPTALNQLVDKSIGLLGEYQALIYDLNECKTIEDMKNKITEFLTFDDSKSIEMNSKNDVHKVLFYEMRYRIGTLLLTTTSMKEYDINKIVYGKYPPVEDFVKSIFKNDVKEDEIDSESQILINEVFPSINDFDTMRCDLHNLITDITPRLIDKIKNIDLEDIIKVNNDKIIDYIKKNDNNSLNPEKVQYLMIFDVAHSVLCSFVPYFLYLSTMPCELFLEAFKIDGYVKETMEYMVCKYGTDGDGDDQYHEQKHKSVEGMLSNYMRKIYEEDFKRR
jgi:hypothetical protein